MANNEFQSANGINKTVLSDQVKQYILDAIERGELQPGERLVESQLARQLRISQAPVREAIRDLVSSRFLEREPHKGVMVRLLTEIEALATRDPAIARRAMLQHIVKLQKERVAT